MLWILVFIFEDWCHWWNKTVFWRRMSALNFKVGWFIFLQIFSISWFLIINQNFRGHWWLFILVMIFNDVFSLIQAMNIKVLIHSRNWELITLLSNCGQLRHTCTLSDSIIIELIIIIMFVKYLKIWLNLSIIMWSLHLLLDPSRWLNIKLMR